MEVVLMGDASICVNAWDCNAQTHYSPPHTYAMNPRELLKQLMAAEGTNTNRLAKAMISSGKTAVNLQSQLSRWLRNPAHALAASTAQPVASYFGIDVGAFWDFKIADRVYREKFGRVSDGDHAVINDTQHIASATPTESAHSLVATSRERALLDAIDRIPADIMREIILRWTDLHEAPSDALQQTAELVGRLNDRGEKQKQGRRHEPARKSKTTGKNRHHSSTR